MKKVFLITLGVFFFWNNIFSQQIPSIRIEEKPTVNLPSLHSFAFGEWDEHWVIIGGRKNGLHGFLPPFAFPSSGKNKMIWVYKPAVDSIWFSDLSLLSDSLYEPLSSSNMQFAQHGKHLVLTGGYGWSDSINDFLTFPSLISIDLEEVVGQVKEGMGIESSFRQKVNPQFAVCGGNMAVLDSVFYLVFGHRFDGRYDVSDTTGFFTQEYTEEIRKLDIELDSTEIITKSIEIISDTNSFHRRDYNLIPQIYPTGEQGLTAFGGVFQKGIDLPYLFPIDITSSDYFLQNTFSQLMSQYHSAVLPAYDSLLNQSTTFFFGGMAQYYIDSLSGETKEDSLIPFVNTISAIIRDSSGNLSEHVLPISMPNLEGTNALFIPIEKYRDPRAGIIRLDKINGEKMVGHIIGGISSPMPNISLMDPSLSFATSKIYEVWLSGSNPNSTSILVLEPLSLKVYPNQGKINTSCAVNNPKGIPFVLEIWNSLGQKLAELHRGAERKLQKDISSNILGLAPGLYYINLKTLDYSKVNKLILD